MSRCSFHYFFTFGRYIASNLITVNNRRNISFEHYFSMLYRVVTNPNSTNVGTKTKVNCLQNFYARKVYLTKHHAFVTIICNDKTIRKETKTLQKLKQCNK